MKLITAIGLLIPLLIVSISLAEDLPSTYQKNGIEFAIPANWSIAKVEQINGSQTDGSPINDTKIVLSDGKSAIRMDIVEISQVKWLHLLYGDPFDYAPNSEVCDITELFYRTKILLDNEKSKSIHSSGGSGLSVQPDDLKYAAFTLVTDGESGIPIEWTLAWTKKEYIDKFIGVHALFKDNYPMKSLNASFGGKYDMQIPLYEFLDSFSMNKTGRSKKDLINKI